MAIDVNYEPNARIVNTGGDRSSRFTPLAPVRRRLIVLASALQKHGKDHFGCTAPGRIAIHAFDVGYEETVAKFVTKGKVIKICEYEVPEPTGKSKDESVMIDANRIWTDFKDNYIWSLENFDTVILDTATEMWELLRLARLGALSTGQTTSFGSLNAEFRKLIREAYNHNANVIFLQKLGKKYVNKEWNGDYEPKGFNDMAYEVQVVLRLYREDPNTFHTVIEDCRQKPELNGSDLVEIGDIPFNSFPYIAADIFDDTPERWF